MLENVFSKLRKKKKEKMQETERGSTTSASKLLFKFYVSSLPSGGCDKVFGEGARVSLLLGEWQLSLQPDPGPPTGNLDLDKHSRNCLMPEILL